MRNKWFWILGLTILGGMIMFSDDIVSAATKYVGEKEKSGNAGFANAQLEKDMRAVGWLPTYSWCVFFVKMIYKKVFETKSPKHWAVASKLINGNSQVTWNNFKNDKSSLFKLSQTPLKGSIAIWQNYVGGVAQATGHAGIVINVTSTNFETVEGNTNDKGGSNGDGVYRKTRTYNFTKTEGLRLRGFVNVV